MTVFGGILALVTGLAYTALGAVTAYELIRHRARGFSHFGLAFLVMAATCGPHHLAHAYRHLIAGEAAHGPHVAALTLGLAPAVIFIALRVEALFGGRGDRLLVRTPWWLQGLPVLMAAAAGATLWEGLRHADAHGVDLRALIPNLFGPGLHAEMAYYETDAGARVFSAGVLDFPAVLLHPTGMRLMDNLWRHMLAPPDEDDEPES